MNENVLHLSIFWRIILFPIFSIWFLFQLFVFSFVAGIPIFMLGLLSIIGEIGHRNWEEKVVESFGYMTMPITAPFIWLYFYFKYGQYCTLFAD